MKGYKVYKHTSPNGKVYIGITCQDVECRWKNGKGYKDNEYFVNAINKYGWDNFDHEVICGGLSKYEAETLEKDLISSLNSSDRRYGYNIQKGGGVGRLSEETKRKISEANKGRCGELNNFFGKTHSEETKEKLRNANLGRKQSELTKLKKSLKLRGENAPLYGRTGKKSHWYGIEKSEETRQRIRDSKIGHEVSKEVREKISQTLKGRFCGKDNPTSKQVMCIETDEIFECGRAACKKYNINPANMSAHLHGRKKSVNKLHFKFITNND